MPLPAMGTITAFSFADNVGRIQLDEGQELRVGASALGHGVVPAVGTRVRVSKVEPHPLGGLRATEVTMADTIMSEGAREQAVYELVAAQGTGPAPASLESMAWVKPEPLPDHVRAEYAARANHEAEHAAHEVARVRELALATERMRKLRAAIGPAATWGPILRQAGIPSGAALQLLSHGRPAATMGPRSAANANASCSITSRFGGAPDAPPGFAWPSKNDRPLSFLLQLRLSEVPESVRQDLSLPFDGVLALFYNVVEQPWGFDPDDRGAARVAYFEDVASLARPPIPDELIPEWVVREEDIAFFEELSLPSLESPAGTALGLSDHLADAYASALDADVSGRGDPLHKIGGYADEIQGAMELECAGVTNGLYFGDAKAAISDEIRAEAPRWRLLVQIDTDEMSGMMWGDSGRLYVWLREDHARARRFEHAWCVLQCG